MQAKQKTPALGGGRGSIHGRNDDAHYINFHRSVGEHRAPCPMCDKGPKDDALAIKIDPDGSGVAYCHRCQYVETARGWRAVPERKPSKTEHAKPEGWQPWMRELWGRCLPIGGVAADYLRSRHCVIPPADGDLRYTEALKHRSGHVGPALVGLITDAITNRPMGLHRTWITATGKADVTPSKMMVGTAKGGVIRLWPDEDVSYGLGIAEGLETALSLAHALRPVWCCMDAGNLAKFPPLPGIESLTIARDNDPAGIDAAYKCSAAWTAAGAEVLVTNQPQNDLNDAVREVAA